MTDHATEQVALFMNARDHRDYGTATWSELDIVGREAYLTDAAALVAAVKALGWAPALTPTDGEREALLELLGPILHLPISEIRDRILAAGFRRSEVPEPRAEEPDLPNGHAPIEKLAPFLARRIVGAPEGPTVTQEAIALLDAMNAEGRIIYADYSRLQDLISSSEPQGEPSDASVDAARSEIAAHMNYKTQPTRGAMRAALRAAGVVGQEGEQR